MQRTGAGSVPGLCSLNASSMCLFATHTETVPVTVPLYLQADYDARCDPASPAFALDNRAVLERTLRMHVVMSFVGFLQILFALLKLMLPFVLPPKLPIADIKDWVEAKQCLPKQSERGSTWQDSPSPKRKSLRETIDDGDSEERREVRRRMSASRRMTLAGMFISSNEESDDEEIVIVDTLEEAEYYDPNDFHHTAPLQEVLPSSHEFDLDKATWYFDVRLREPAKIACVTLPWSNRFHLALFCGQVVQVIHEAVVTAVSGPFTIFELAKRDFSLEMWVLTWRLDVFMPWLYLMVRILVLQYKVETLVGGLRHGPLARLFGATIAWFDPGVHEGQQPRNRAPFSRWLHAPVIATAATCVLAALPILPALACAMTPSFISVGFICRYRLRNDAWPFSKAVLVLGSFALFFAWVTAVSQISTRWLSLGSTTYLCPYSRFDLFTRAPGSVGSFLLVTLLFAIIVIVLSGSIATALCLPLLLSPVLILELWLYRNFGYAAYEDMLGHLDNAFHVATQKPEVERERRTSLGVSLLGSRPRILFARPGSQDSYIAPQLLDPEADPHPMRGTPRLSTSSRTRLGSEAVRLSGHVRALPHGSGLTSDDEGQDSSDHGSCPRYSVVLDP